MIKSIGFTEFKGLKDVKLDDLRAVNVFCGKNNSGKSTILHSIDFIRRGLALKNVTDFPLKLAIEDLFTDVSNFCARVEMADGKKSEFRFQSKGTHVEFAKDSATDINFRSVIIMPESSVGFDRRHHFTPAHVWSQIRNERIGSVSAFDILHTLKFYGERNENGFTMVQYNSLIESIKRFFPELKTIESSRTDQDIATIRYSEQDRILDLVYSGAGLKYVVEILIKLELTGASVALLDEPETGLHPNIQRQLVDFIVKYSKEKAVQFFISTHSPIFLMVNENAKVIKVLNDNGNRRFEHVSGSESVDVLDELGIKPSDIFLPDLVVMVEGAMDVIYFEHLVRNVFADEFKGIFVSVCQYGGGAIDALLSDDIDVDNLVQATKKHVLWIHDRDAAIGEATPNKYVELKRKIESKGGSFHILDKRAIEYYLTEDVFRQMGYDENELAKISKVLRGKQEKKFKAALNDERVATFNRSKLGEALAKAILKTENVDKEIRELFSSTLIAWKNELSKKRI